MKILIADKFPEQGIDELRQAGCEVISDPKLEGDALRAAIAETACTALVVRSTQVTRPMLAAGDALRLVIRAGAGYDTIDVAAATKCDVRVCNCPGKNSVAVAELAIGLMVSLDRRIVDNTIDLRRGVWNKKEYSQARGLKGRTLGVVGLGRIGYEIARRAAAFEMKLIYSDVVENKAAEEELGIRKCTFEELLAEVDFVTLHVPGGGSTKHMMSTAQFAMMKPTAFVINCSRGGVVDEAALAAALESGTIAGAAFDVYENEPGPADGEFHGVIAQAPHFYGTHHIGASTDQAQNAVAEETARIVRTFLKTGEFLNCVNPGSAASGS
ncbi:MAG: hydroxyacid dehydrogenase [Planctomycetes bacterium]|nr:hydroxyacid dehydrogenase [Planctomycetota bacterium]